jgi:hypothetical protein
MTQYLYGAAVQGIQNFIFQTNKLREIVGLEKLWRMTIFKYYDEAAQLFYKLQHSEGTVLSLVGQGICLTESENYPEAEKILGRH